MSCRQILKRTAMVLLLTLVAGSFYLWGQTSKRGDNESCEERYAEALENGCTQFVKARPRIFTSNKQHGGAQESMALDLAKQCSFAQATGRSPQLIAPRIVGDLRDFFLLRLFPLPLSYDHCAIYSYPGLYDARTGKSTCPQADCQVPDPIQDAQHDVLTFSQSVGRLVLKPTNSYRRSHRSPGGPPYNGPYFWGSAFMIANTTDYGVIATTCHELESLVEKNKDSDGWHLRPDASLQIDFGAKSDEYAENGQFDIERLIAIGDGVDVAFLSVKPSPNGTPKLPDALPLYTGDQSCIVSNPGEEPHYLALVGYADLEHFADSITERAYRVFEDHADPDAPEVDKFAILDWLLPPLKGCPKPGLASLHVAGTTVGASGSILMDLGEGSKEKSTNGNGENHPTVVAMHTCCSKYFPEQKADPPKPDFPCAHLTRTFPNQAVGSWAILTDKNLCKELMQDQVQGAHCPNAQ